MNPVMHTYITRLLDRVQLPDSDASQVRRFLHNMEAFNEQYILLNDIKLSETTSSRRKSKRQNNQKDQHTANLNICVSLMNEDVERVSALMKAHEAVIMAD